MVIRGFVVFTTSDDPADVGARMEGQALPRGSKVLVAVDEDGNRAVLHGYEDDPMGEAIIEAESAARAEAARFDPHWLRLAGDSQEGIYEQGIS